MQQQQNQSEDFDGEVNNFASSIEIDQQLLASIDCFLKLKSATLRQSYEHFIDSNQGVSTLTIVNLLFGAFTLPCLFAAIVNVCSGKTTPFEHYNCIASIIFVVLNNIFGWWVYRKLRAVIRECGNKISPEVGEYIRSMQMRVMFLFEVFLCYFLIARVVAGECPNVDWIKFSCNPDYGSKSLPTTSVICAMLLPLVHVIAAKGAHLRYSVMLWLMSMFSMIGSIIYMRAYNSIGTILLYLAGSIVVFIESKRTGYFLFFTHIKLVQVLRDKKREFDEETACEMRHMVANVAHDIKTPLSSFLVSVDCIEHVLNDFKLHLAEKSQLSSLDAEDLVENISSCVNNMRVNNSFMLMTINRCIDYTKASKGVKLVPKYETVDLMETLSLPLNCMKDIQQRVSIVLEAVSKEICSHIITDKQWLQENVLCLLSNAVKYSNEGEVNVRLNLCSSLFDGDKSDLLSLDLDDDKKNARFAYPFFRSRSSIKPLEEQENVMLETATVENVYFLRIEVEDHGIGISSEAMTTLFTAFKQAQRLAGGTGLGLYSLAKRVEALEGRYGVRNRRDGQQGSLFWFEIPYRPDDFIASWQEETLTCASSSPVPPSITVRTGIMESSVSRGCSNSENCLDDRLASIAMNDHSHEHRQDSDADTMSRLSPKAVTPTILTQKRKPLDILLVDDSPTILKITSVMLKRHKHRVTTAVNGAEAVKIANDRLERSGRGFDVILMDLQMPVMDGLEATRRIREFECQMSSGYTTAGFASSSSDGPIFALGVQIPFFSGKSRSIDSSTRELDGSQRLPLNDPVQFSGRQIIIGVSANSDSDTEEDAFQMGIDAFIPKPFSLDTFYLCYDRLLFTLNAPSPL